MSIYHQNLKHISRGKGQSACAAAAYRSASKIYDERLGKTHNYEKKQGVDHTEILAPAYAPSWISDRAQLWNQAEKKDTRINARPASELDIALPIELNQQQKIELIKTFAQTTLVSRGLIVDLACHDLDSHNPHAHLMFTTRKINEQGLGEKDRAIKSKDFLNSLRQTWEKQANDALSQAKIPERIDHRSLEAQGIVDRQPQIHLGPNVCQMKARGIPTDRGDQYDEIERANTNLQKLYQQQEKLNTEIQTEQQRQQEKEEKRRRKQEKKRQKQQAKQRRQAEKKQAQQFNQLDELDSQRDTRHKWNHLSFPDSQKLNQSISIYDQFKQIFNDQDFPTKKLETDSELNSPQSQFKFRITYKNQEEYWVCTKTDQNFYLTQLNHKDQNPQELPKKLHLTLNDNQPVLKEYNLKLGEYDKLRKTIPNILKTRLSNQKAKQQEARQQKEEEERKREQQKARQQKQELNQLYRQIEQVYQERHASDNFLYLSESTNQELRQIFQDPPQAEYFISEELGGYSIRELDPIVKKVAPDPEQPELAALEKLFLATEVEYSSLISKGQDTREKLLDVNWQSRQQEEQQKQELEQLHHEQEKERQQAKKRQQSKKFNQNKNDREENEEFEM